MSFVIAGVAAVGVTVGAVQAIKGGQEVKAGRRAEALAKANKPELQIPPEIAKNMSIAEKQAYQGLPDAQKREFLDNQQRALQSAMRSTSTRKGGLGIISQLQGQQNLSNRQLLQADWQAQQQNTQRAMEARAVMAGYKDKRFEHEYNEYVSDLDYARARIGAGKQNVSKGLNQIGSSAMSFAGSGAIGGGGGAGGAPQMKQGGGFMGTRSPMAASRLENPGLSSEGTPESLIQDMTNSQKKGLFDPSGSTTKSQWSKFGQQGAVGTYQPGVGVGNQIFGGSQWGMGLDYSKFPNDGKTY
ncbi:hypothetical protein H8D85_02335 [bacterium]|nr:hypothetical protein [bacterium]